MIHTFQCSAHGDRFASCLAALDRLTEPSAASPAELAGVITCPIERIKHRIIRLRRKSHDDWTYFRSEVEQCGAFLCEQASTRWLVSICDTFADYGNPSERGQAMCISMMVNWEKLAMTDRLAGDLLDDCPDSAPHRMQAPQPLWDGVTSMIVGEGADMLPNLLSRTDQVLASTPLLQEFYRTIVRRLQAHQRSTIRRLDHVHERDLRADVLGAIGDAVPARRIDRSAAAQTSAVSAGSDEPALSGSEFQRVTLEALQGLTGGISTLIHRAEEQHAEVGTAVEALTETSDRLAQATEKVAMAFEQFAGMRFNEHTWNEDMRYRDVLQLLDRLTPIAPELDVELKTDYPVASGSIDHMYPHGTARDNTRAPWFVAKCEKVIGPAIDFLDIGSAGGGLVFDFTLRGHRAIGLEGSDYSKKRLRAEWRNLEDRLFTCDVTKPFELIDKEQSERMQFDLITAWDVMEHFEERQLDAVFENVRAHLRPGGVFLGTISTQPSVQAPDGGFYHATVRPREWWERVLAERGFSLDQQGMFEPVDFARGNAPSPRHQQDFFKQPEAGFHFVARYTGAPVGESTGRTRPQLVLTP